MEGTEELINNCVCKMSTDVYENMLRLIKIDETNAKLSHVRFLYPNRDIVFTVPTSVLKFVAKDYTRYVHGN